MCSKILIILRLDNFKDFHRGPHVLGYHQNKDALNMLCKSWLHVLSIGREEPEINFVATFAFSPQDISLFAYKYSKILKDKFTSYSKHYRQGEINL